MELFDKIRKAKRTYIIGNGGSAANAVHICNDLLACGVKAYTLDFATLTASANDYGYETVFERWIEVVGEPGDLLLALSGSGKSKNILNAMSRAVEKGMDVFLVTNYLAVDMQRSEEIQLEIGHEVMREFRWAALK